MLGPPPARSPSLQDYPACDEQVRKLAAEMWANCDGQNVKQVRFGQGQVFRGLDLPAVLAELKTPPDVAGVNPKKLLWTHRSAGDADIYFLSSQSEHAVSIAPVFRVAGKAPELWYADSGRIVRAAAFEPVDGGVRVPIELEPRGSVFVVFRTAAGPVPAVTQVTRDGQVVLTTAAKAAEPQAAAVEKDSANNFTLAGWLKPGADIALPTEADTGVFLQLARNDVVFPRTAPRCSATRAMPAPACPWAATASRCTSTRPAISLRCSSTPQPLADWTHVAVVYEGGRPSLYLNGTLARQGLQSRYTVHPSPGGGQGGPGGPFKGELGEIQQLARALTAAEIAELAKSSPPAADAVSLPVVTMTRGADGGLEAEVSAAGSYRVKLAGGQERSFDVSAFPAPLDIGGPWEVCFPAKMDVPERTVFERLMSWTEHPQEAIRCFSGTATYRRTFDLPADRLGDGRSVLLDLGQVESLAEVLVNGRNLGVLWKPPFIVDVTSAAQPGTNTLEVRVTNAWLNRLIGDKKYPNGFPGRRPVAVQADPGRRHQQPFGRPTGPRRPDRSGAHPRHPASWRAVTAAPLFINRGVSEESPAVPASLTLAGLRCAA